MKNRDLVSIVAGLSLIASTGCGFIMRDRPLKRPVPREQPVLNVPSQRPYQPPEGVILPGYSPPYQAPAAQQPLPVPAEPPKPPEMPQTKPEDVRKAIEEQERGQRKIAFGGGDDRDYNNHATPSVKISDRNQHHLENIANETHSRVQWYFNNDHPARRSLMTPYTRLRREGEKYFIDIVPITTYKGQDLKYFRFKVKIADKWSDELNQKELSSIELTEAQYSALSASGKHIAQEIFYKPHGNRLEICASFNEETQSSVAQANTTGEIQLSENIGATNTDAKINAQSYSNTVQIDGNPSNPSNASSSQMVMASNGKTRNIDHLMQQDTNPKLGSRISSSPIIPPSISRGNLPDYVEFARQHGWS